MIMDEINRKAAEQATKFCRNVFTQSEHGNLLQDEFVSSPKLRKKELRKRKRLARNLQRIRDEIRYLAVSSEYDKDRMLYLRTVEEKLEGLYDPVGQLMEELTAPRPYRCSDFVKETFIPDF